MIQRLLIANRGEIAIRIIRACAELGIESVAVYSDADAKAPHVLAADHAVAIGPAPAHESYLSVPTLLDAARTSGANAIHPGYGFLSENAAFAAACAGAGLIFVGPPADVITQMGSKIGARRLVAAAGVPVVPGETPDDQSDRGIRQAIDRVGLPALIKASAGGGGKGMRNVLDARAIDESIQAARRESVAAFGDGTLYVERLVAHARHVEVQIFADNHGHVLHLFERDCSTQRRHQKVIEESPSPALTPGLRARMTDAAVAAARAANYRNAGTIEFLVDGDQFYFLEMNMRLQVEHPVTEQVTGLDLVRLQEEIAAGARLPFGQEQVAWRGSAIECRIYAEDPYNNFLPFPGKITRLTRPLGPGVRIDGCIYSGWVVPMEYDPLLAKLAVWAGDREAAAQRMLRALREYDVSGIRTNLGFFRQILEDAEFRAGRLHTGFIDEFFERHRAPQPPADLAAVAALAAALHTMSRNGAGPPQSGGARPSAWLQAGRTELLR